MLLFVKTLWYQSNSWIFLVLAKDLEKQNHLQHVQIITQLLK